MKSLWKFYWDVRRGGNVSGIFVATDEEVAKAIGEEVYFGEILGKHSDIYGTLEETDLTKITSDQDFIAKFEEFKCSSGYNPLEYLREEEMDS